MSFLRKLEEAAAKRLKRLFLGAKKYADSAISDLEKAEKELALARKRAAEATEREHTAAVEAAEKAQAVANQLMIEVRAAEERMLVHKEILEKSVK
jgi:CRISPR/Cas system-associated protein Cas10 (large subunit of type III CRISPR-Cas system)